MQTIGRDRIVYGRDAYEPAWTPNFSDTDLNAPVRDGDKLLGFRIRDVLPERRWAIRENGELLSEQEFKPLYQQWASKVVVGGTTGNGRIVPISAYNGVFDVNLIPIPNPRDFVSVAHDYQGREIRIGFDPHRPPESGVRVVLRDGNGREVDPLAPSARKIERITVLTEMRDRGLITQEQFDEELRGTLAVPHRILEENEDVAAKSDEVEKVPRGKYEREKVDALCGRACHGNAGKLAHERTCPRCRAIALERSNAVSSEVGSGGGVE